MVAEVFAADATMVGKTLLERLIETKESRSSFSNMVMAIVMASPKIQVIPLSHLIDVFGESELVSNIFEYSNYFRKFSMRIRILANPLLLSTNVSMYLLKDVNCALNVSCLFLGSRILSSTLLFTGKDIFERKNIYVYYEQNGRRNSSSLSSD